MSPTIRKGFLRSFIVGFFTMLIVACSGDGSLTDGTGTDSEDNGVYAFSVAYQTSEGIAKSQVSTGETLNVRAVLTRDSEPVEGETITFTNDSTLLATLSSNTAQTDAEGVAIVTLTGGTTSGTGTITVSTNVGQIEPLVTSFTSNGTISQHQVFLVSNDTQPADYAAVTGSTMTTISASNPGLLLVRLVDSAGNPIPNDIAYVELDEKSSELATLSVGNGGIASNSEGFAALTLEATDIAGAGRVNVLYSDEVVASLVFESAGDGGVTVVQNIGSVELIADSFQMASSGAQFISLTALVKDEKNNLIEDIPVSFEATSGGLKIVQPTTGTNGLAEAELGTRNAPETREITVTAFVGDKSDQVTINVIGTTIKVIGNSSIVTGNSAVYSLALIDSDGGAIGQQKVFIESAEGNDLTKQDGTALDFDETAGMSFVTTNDQGVAELKYSATTSGTDTLIASALGERNEFVISVSPDKFIIDELTVAGEVATNTDVPMTQGGVFKLVWEKDGSAFEGDVLFSTTRGQIFAKDADPSTDDPITTTVSTSAADGSVEVMLVSTNAGPAILTAKANGLSATYEFEFVAETAHLLTLQASPFSIGPNGQKSTISAVVRDADGNLVKNRPVNFQLFDVSGGELFPATDVTDSNGLATTVYTSNTVSASEGAIIAACTDTADSSSNCVNTRETNNNANAADDTYSCSVTDKDCVSNNVKVTVAERELFITAGIGNALAEASDQEYQFDIPVYVTDVNSNPISGVELSISAVPTSYGKGFWVKEINPEDDTFVKWVTNRVITCPNEDLDKDGIMDQEVDGIGFNEDVNGDGSLTPGNIVRTSGSFVTDVDGATMISLIYAQSYAGWIDLDFAVTAKVAGTEHSRNLSLTLPVLKDDVSDEKFPPVQHNYGVVADCSTTD